MSSLIIKGNQRLEGEISLHGAKNSALPILAATVICNGECIIHNVPRLSDIDAAIRILRHVGCIVYREDNTVVVNSKYIDCDSIPDNLMREMRSSIIFLGSILARCKKATLSGPGGCELGPRPIDIHISALKRLGAQIDEDHGNLNCRIEKGLHGAEITFPLPSVGATENAMILASVAKGKTVIRNAAREPEIKDLADFLKGAGAKISGEESGTIEITGVSSLSGVEHTVIPDRIAVSTYMSAVSITGGELLMNNVVTEHIVPVTECFKAAGVKLLLEENKLFLKAPPKLKGGYTVKTHFYPGFPTDAAPTTLAMMSAAEGTSVFVENIFSNRFKYIDELKRMGAKVSVEGKVAIVNGVDDLWGSTVECTDLRGGAALVVAALKAHGTTKINKIYHIDRGYDSIECYLKKLGAEIIRK